MKPQSSMLWSAAVCLSLSAFAALPAAAKTHGSASKHLHDVVDPYTGQRVVSLEIDTGHCQVETSEDHNATHVKLWLTASRSPESPLEYTLIADLSGGLWITTGKRSSMETVVDGQQDTLYLTGKRSQWKEIPSFSGTKHKDFRETIPFGIDDAFVRSLSEAKSFQFRVRGKNTMLERCTDAYAMREVKLFLGAAATL